MALYLFIYINVYILIFFMILKSSRINNCNVGTVGTVDVSILLLLGNQLSYYKLSEISNETLMNFYSLKELNEIELLNLGYVEYEIERFIKYSKNKNVNVFITKLRTHLKNLKSIS